MGGLGLGRGEEKLRKTGDVDEGKEKALFAWGSE